jgi:hypothetical protein
MNAGKAIVFIRATSEGCSCNLKGSKPPGVLLLDQREFWPSAIPRENTQPERDFAPVLYVGPTSSKEGKSFKCNKRQIASTTLARLRFGIPK